MGMRTLSRYEEEFDRDAEQNSEARVINVSPLPARFEIATTPGAKPRRYKLEPGQSMHLQAGYTRAFQGAGRQPVRATIEALTEREAFPRGPALPQVVHEDRAREIGRAWEAAMVRAKAPPAPQKVMLPSADGGDPIEMTVQPAGYSAEPVPMRGAPIEDDEDQAGDLDEPPPDHNDPDPSEIPTIPSAAETANAKAKSKARG